MPCLPSYLDIRIEISSDNRFTDIVAERFDIGVRLGGDVAKDMIAVRMAPDMRMVAVAAPGYFAQRPRPAKPQDLADRDCIGLRLPKHGGRMMWEFRKRARQVNAHVAGRLVFNSSELIVSAALAGHGLGWAPADLIAEHVACGQAGHGARRRVDLLSRTPPLLREPPRLAGGRAGGGGVAGLEGTLSRGGPRDQASAPLYSASSSLHARSASARL